MFFFLFTSLIIVQEQSLEVASNDGITRVGELLDLHVFKSIGVCFSSLSSSSFIFYYSSTSLPPFFSFLFYFGAYMLFISTYFTSAGPNFDRSGKRLPSYKLPHREPNGYF